MVGVLLSTRGCVKVYGDLSKSIPSGSGVRQACILSPLLFDFVIDEVMKQTLGDLQNPSVLSVIGEKFADLDYADDIVLLFEKEEEVQVVLNRLSGINPTFGLRFAPSKYKVMLQDVKNLRAPLTIQGEALEIVDRFTYLGSCISSDCSVANEVDARISKARVTFANLRHLWRQKGISLSLKGRMYGSTVRQRDMVCSS